MMRILQSLFLLLVALALPLHMGATAQAAESVTATTPAPNVEYTLAPGDKVRIVVFGEDNLSGEYVVTSGGNLSFPLIGNVAATDKTVETLQVALTKALADGYLNDPRVSIQVVSFRPFYILGEVGRPGEYAVSTGLTLQQAVATAAGYTYRANTRKVFIRRANETSETLLDLRRTGPVIVRAGDTIRIPERHF
ncbi:polysaccharide biosynthesis/export family protein [Polymorphobacter fuscus]|uniref:Polysaccharide export protein n=1 Tax=Sandarakinorhabdus fusca TaxID=1439888 RepID=A0A7C9GVD8_9SPHN|nr:polysaccharide biosynthesis/export family protein [Polymorphobacter fuscus]KAB7647927.1 polysaccharide export protein [Polymorphobacter fuscus]MQT17249.1 polysaccharide export protein [Polymorphobacter fuscus]NJC08756.1 polysaccharide export outer membrane protein [Polymorphobacter fuscus]